jgi:hypothetical protein
MLCKLNEEIKNKLNDIYNRGKEHDFKLSENDNWYKEQYELLGVTEKDWLLFICDKMGIIYIHVD